MKSQLTKKPKPCRECGQITKWRGTLCKGCSHQLRFRRHPERVRTLGKVRNARLRVSSFRNFINSALQTIRKRETIAYDLSIEYLMDLLVIQNYQCAVTKIIMAHQCHDPRSVSIDRIDNTKGHVKGNIQLVCKFINLGRGGGTDQQCRAFIQHIQMDVLKKLKARNLLKLGDS